VYTSKQNRKGQNTIYSVYNNKNDQKTLYIEKNKFDFIKIHEFCTEKYKNKAEKALSCFSVFVGRRFVQANFTIK